MISKLIHAASDSITIVKIMRRTKFLAKKNVILDLILILTYALSFVFIQFSIMFLIHY